MKRTLLTLIFIVTGLIHTSATVARDMDDQYAVFGMGAENCAAYLVARERGDVVERWFHHWLAGYLSAVNNAAASTFNILGEKSMADILDWLEGYCTSDPNINFSSAVANMIAILFEDRQNIAPGKQGGWNKFIDHPPAQPSP